MVHFPISSYIQLITLHPICLCVIFCTPRNSYQHLVQPLVLQLCTRLVTSSFPSHLYIFVLCTAPISAQQAYQRMSVGICWGLHLSFTAYGGELAHIPCTYMPILTFSTTTATALTLYMLAYTQYHASKSHVTCVVMLSCVQWYTCWMLIGAVHNTKIYITGKGANR